MTTDLSNLKRPEYNIVDLPDKLNYENVGDIRSNTVRRF